MTSLTFCSFYVSALSTVSSVNAKYLRKILKFKKIQSNVWVRLVVNRNNWSDQSVVDFKIKDQKLDFEGCDVNRLAEKKFQKCSTESGKKNIKIRVNKIKFGD